MKGVFTSYFAALLIMTYTASCSSDEVEKPQDSIIPVAAATEGPTAFGNDRVEEFSFIQICDTQLGVQNYDQDLQNFSKAVDQINALDVDFVILCGDLVHQAPLRGYDDFNLVRANFDMPSYVAAGNHDIGLNQNLGDLENYRTQIGVDYYDFEHKGVGFTVTNTQFWKVDWDEESTAHDIWFGGSLNSFRDQSMPTIVIGHYPLFNGNPLEQESGANLPIDERSEILSLFTENNVKAYLSGHNHEYIEHEYEGIITVSGESTSKNFDGSPLGFRIWNVTQENLTHDFIALDL